MSNLSDLKLRPEWYGPHGVLAFNEKTHGPTFGTSLWRSCPMSAILQYPEIAHVYFNDFHEFDAAQFTVTEDAGKTGADAMIDRAGGWITIYCDGDDNDECYYGSDGEGWLFAASKPLWFESKIQLTEAAADDANWIIGLIQELGADALGDNGAGPPSTHDGAVFFKVDGTLQIQFETSNATTQVTTASGLSAFVSATSYRVGFVFDPLDGVTGSITPYVDGAAGIAHSITLAGLAEMHLIFGVKAGGTNEEHLDVDYVKVVQMR